MNTNQSAKPLWLVFSLSNLWIIVSSFVMLPSSQNQPLSAFVKGCQFDITCPHFDITCPLTKNPAGGSLAPHTPTPIPAHWEKDALSAAAEWLEDKLC